jgi:hypothetical protein
MQYGIYILGMLAAALTSLSYLPRLQKAIPRNYHGKIEVHHSLLRAVLHDKPEIERDKSTSEQ